MARSSASGRASSGYGSTSIFRSPCPRCVATLWPCTSNSSVTIATTGFSRCLDDDRVLDRERRARSARAEADDRAVDPVRELVDVLAVVGAGLTDHAAGLDERRWSRRRGGGTAATEASSAKKSNATRPTLSSTARSPVLPERALSAIRLVLLDEAVIEPGDRRALPEHLVARPLDRAPDCAQGRIEHREDDDRHKNPRERERAETPAPSPGPARARARP